MNGTISTEFLSVKDLANMLRVSLGTIYKLCELGELACFRFGPGRGSIRIARRDADAYVERCRVEARSEKPIETGRRAPGLDVVAFRPFKHLRPPPRSMQPPEDGRCTG